MINDRLHDFTWSARHITILMMCSALFVTACPKEKSRSTTPEQGALPSIVPSSTTPSKTPPTPKPKVTPPKKIDTPKPTTHAKTGVFGGLKLATWNIEWLNRSNGKGKTPRRSEDYATLKRYAKKLNADVIALQEIDGPDAARRVFDPNIYAFHFEKRAGDQLVGIAYKKSLKVTKHPDFKDLQMGRSRLRAGVEMTVEVNGGKKLRVLAVHLKSGCWSSPLGGPVRGGERPEACKMIKSQNQVLKRWIDSQHRKNTPFVIMGDFNRRLKPRETFWLNLQKSKQRADLVSPTIEKRSKCLKGRFPDYIDHIIFGGPATRGVSISTFNQVTYSNDDMRRHYRKLSDHCPIRMTLNRL